MADSLTKKSSRKNILGCGCLVGLLSVGMAIVGGVLVLLGLFFDKPSKEVDVTSFAKTHEIHARHEAGVKNEVVLKLTLTGKSGYWERSNTGRRGRSDQDLKLAYTIPLKLKVFDANSGTLLHEHTQLLGYDRKTSGDPKDGGFIATVKTEHITLPDLKHAGDVRYELTLDENKDYDFTLEKASFQIRKREAGYIDKLASGLSIVWLAVPTGLAAASILLFGLLYGRRKTPRSIEP